MRKAPCGEWRQFAKDDPKQSQAEQESRFDAKLARVKVAARVAKLVHHLGRNRESPHERSELRGRM